MASWVRNKNCIELYFLQMIYILYENNKKLLLEGKGSASSELFSALLLQCIIIKSYLLKRSCFNLYIL
jgi:hypothetical protein